MDGKRVLTGKEAQQRAKAMACVRSRSPACQGQVHVGLFFDGTGNNHKWKQDEHNLDQRARNKHSNVARLWDAHLDEPSNGFFKYYIPGVGTPFEDVGDILKPLTDIGGNGFAFMGAERVNWGITSLLNAVHFYLRKENLFDKEAQKKIVSLMSLKMLSMTLPLIDEGGIRWTMLTGFEEKLAAVVKSHPLKIRQINVSIFGFSRGAAEARACAHWMQQIFEREAGAFELAGVPIRIGFMGIFDTVAAVGLGDITPVTFGHMAWADKTQSIHPAVEQCVHFVALHEQRSSFPLESATGRGNVGYPGMHSDVGGGYCPGEQGKSMPEWGPSPHLSQIPLLDMHFAAMKAGVPMKTIEEIKAAPELAASFSTDSRLLEVYNSWLKTNGVKAGSIKDFTQEHTKQYLRWRGMLHEGNSRKFLTKRFYRESGASDKEDLYEADTNLGIMLRSWRERKGANQTFFGRAREIAKDVAHFASVPGRLFVESGKNPLSVHEDAFLTLMMDATLPSSASIALFEDYVHDSRAGFRPIPGHHEPEWLTGGYARFRNVFIQVDANENLTNNANESLKALKAAGNEAVTHFQKLYKVTLDTYESARNQIHKMSGQVRDVAVAARREADHAARIYNRAQKEIVLKYAKAEKEWRTILQEGWHGLNSAEPQGPKKSEKL
jgi:hypothetical protein